MFFLVVVQRMTGSSTSLAQLRKFIFCGCEANRLAKPGQLGSIPIKEIMILLNK